MNVASEGQVIAVDGSEHVRGRMLLVMSRSRRRFIAKLAVELNQVTADPSLNAAAEAASLVRLGACMSASEQLTARMGRLQEASSMCSAHAYSSDTLVSTLWSAVTWDTNCSGMGTSFHSESSLSVSGKDTFISEILDVTMDASRLACDR